MTIDAAFTHFPVLPTRRLQLRQLKTADAEALFVFKSDLLVTSSYGQEPHESQEDSLAWIERLQADYERRNALFWCLTLTGQDQMIGECTFWNFDAGFQCAEIG
jgi:ribosomal-protein-alanine N-acetyltransferase